MSLQILLYGFYAAALFLLSPVAAEGSAPGSCDPLLGNSGSFKVVLDSSGHSSTCGYYFSSLDSSPLTLDITFSPCGPQPKPTGGYSTSDVVTISVTNVETKKNYQCGSILVPLNGLEHTDDLICQVARNELRQGEYMVDAESAVDAYSGCQSDFKLCKSHMPSQRPKVRKSIGLTDYDYSSFLPYPVFNPAFPVPEGARPTSSTCCEGIVGVSSGYCIEEQCYVTFCLPGYALRQNIDGNNVCYERQHQQVSKT